MCVVGGKLGVHRIWRRQQLAGTGQVRHIGVHLAGEHRVTVQAIELGAFDLGIPISAFHQTNHQAVAAAACQVNHMVDHVGATLQVGLHHKPNAVPAFECRLKTQALQQIQ